jgi:hypothetical protein
MSRGQPLTSLPCEARRLGARLSRAWRAASAAALRAWNSARGMTSPLPRMLHEVDRREVCWVVVILD